MDKKSDTRVNLEWIDDGGYWPCPILGHNWAELRGILKKDATGYAQIASDKYHLEKTADGEYRILWTASSSERPLIAHALIAVRPKKADTFVGLPISIVVPIVAAIASAIATLGVQALATDSAAGVTKNETVPIETYQLCESEKKKTQQENLELAACKFSQQQLHEFVLPRPSQDRVLYLLGQSHGQRLEAIKRLHESNEIVRDITLQAEETYMRNSLVKDYNSISFTNGKSRGQTEALKLLGLGEPQVLTGSDFTLMR